MSSKPSEHAFNFEGVKVAMRQTKDGYAMTLVIHPDDVPPGLFAAPVGQRYMVAMVALDEHEQPIPQKPEAKPKDEKAEAVRYAALLCKEPHFWHYLSYLEEKGGSHGFISNEAEAADWLRGFLRIGSRADLAKDATTLHDFNRLTADYRRWSGIE